MWLEALPSIEGNSSHQSFENWYRSISQRNLRWVNLLRQIRPFRLKWCLLPLISLNRRSIKSCIKFRRLIESELPRFQSLTWSHTCYPIDYTTQRRLAWNNHNNMNYLHPFQKILMCDFVTIISWLLSCQKSFSNPYWIGSKMSRKLLIRRRNNNWKLEWSINQSIIPELWLKILWDIWNQV